MLDWHRIIRNFCPRNWQVQNGQTQMPCGHQRQSKSNTVIGTDGRSEDADINKREFIENNFWILYEYKLIRLQKNHILRERSLSNTVLCHGQFFSNTLYRHPIALSEGKILVDFCKLEANLILCISQCQLHSIVWYFMTPKGCQTIWWTK